MKVVILLQVQNLLQGLVTKSVILLLTRGSNNTLHQKCSNWKIQLKHFQGDCDYIKSQVMLKIQALTFKDWLLGQNVISGVFIPQLCLLCELLRNAGMDYQCHFYLEKHDTWHTHFFTACSLCIKKGEIITLILPLYQGIPALVPAYSWPVCWSAELKLRGKLDIEF